MVSLGGVGRKEIVLILPIVLDALCQGLDNAPSL
jgi:hypothetical protein